MEAIVSAVTFLGLCGLLFACSIIDIRERKIPNWLVASVVGLWLVWRIVLDGIGYDLLASMSASLTCALIFGLALLLFVALAERLTGKFMMGGGDIKLLVVVALFLGIDAVLVALFAACLVSLLYAAAHLKRGIPFAPCIMCGTMFALLV